ncbi:MAG: hypothetical protein NTY38_20155 [Acidobacteria bacterium]|nr:hypothetical protein [Acidobacteriota bacterium]
MLSILFACACLGGDWELGGAAGYAFHRNGSVNGSAGTATAGFQKRYTFSAVVTEEMFEHFGGEMRYSYHDGSAFLKSGATSTERDSRSHAIHYDALFHARPTDSRFRPFTIRTNTDVVPMLVVGPGIKYRVTDHMILRFDFQDQISTFPKGIFVPAPGGSTKGIFHQFMPMVGISAAF